MAKNVWLESFRSLVGSVHFTSWNLRSSIQFESVNPRGAVEKPLIDCCLGSRERVRLGMISEAYICSQLAVAGWEEEAGFPCDRCWGGRARIGRFRWELTV